jgi:hypothetical protein
MRPTIFLGPTLPLQRARALLDADYCPPVAQGDVIRAVRRGVAVIGIVDGVFSAVPAVWHKEILWAMASGVHVFGAASMGALRAAELARFGMRGIGSIYAAFASGELEDDDEVAVAHGNVDTAYRSSSEPMVNLRATLAALRQAGVVSGEEESSLRAFAKALFYPDRTHHALLEHYATFGHSSERVLEFGRELRSRSVDLKGEDAVLLLEAVRDFAHTEPMRASFEVAETDAWRDALSSAGRLRTGDDVHRGVNDQLAAEVRLAGEEGQVLLARALGRAATQACAKTRALTAPEAAVAAVRLEHVLAARRAAGPGGATPEWRTLRGISEHHFAALLRAGHDVDWFVENYADEVEQAIVDELSLSESYATLVERARAKAALLERSGLEQPTLADAGLGATELLEWYASRLGLPKEALMPLRGELGIFDLFTLQTEALREFLFLRLQEGHVATKEA